MIGFFLASRAISMSVLKAMFVSQGRGISRWRRDSGGNDKSNVLFRLLPMQNRQRRFPIGKNGTPIGKFLFVEQIFHHSR
jgi:hypothetical protein